MRSWLKIALFPVFIFFLFFAQNLPATAETPDEESSIVPVKYQADWNSPPFAYVENNSLTGFDIDLIRLIFNPESYDLSFSDGYWNYTYELLKNCDVDTCGILPVDTDKKNDIFFSAPVLKSYISVYSPKSAAVESGLKISDLPHYTIGTGKGMYAESILKKELGITPYKTYDSIETAVTALQNGEIDLLFENQDVVNHLLVKKNIGSDFSILLSDLYPFDMAYGVSKARPELVARIDERLSKLKKSGTYEELYVKHFNKHSQYYYENARSKTILSVLLSAFAALLVFLLVRLYLRRRKIRSRYEMEQALSKGIIDNAKTIIIVCSLEGSIEIFNKFAQEITGCSFDSVKGRRINEFPALSKFSDIGKLMLECLVRGSSLQNIEKSVISAENSKVNVLWNIDVIKDNENKPLNIVAMGIDITDRKNTELKLTESYQELEAVHEELVHKEIELKLQYDDLNMHENELRRSEERYRLAVEGVNDGIWDWDGRDGKLFMSKQSRTIMGFDNTQEYMTIEKWFNVIAKEDQDRFIRSLNRYVTEPQKKHFQIEYRISAPENGVKWIRTRGMAIWDDSGIPVRVAGSITDITEQRLTDEKVHQLAYYDSLTGLPNRTLLMDRFIVAAAAAQRKQRRVAVFFLDLDNFKTINDTIGHSFGDQLLQKVGEQLRCTLRRSDTLARLGGDEFIMLQANIKDMEEVSHLASRMLDIFKNPWTLDEREFFVTASIGISVYPDDGSDLQELMKNADAAMYRAKESGKNNFQIYTQELNMRIMERMEIENNLRRASDKDEFVIYYQPMIELSTGRVTCVEALIRWANPAIGWVMPDSFIHIAEEIGLIGKIGEWVLRSACRQLYKWHEQGYFDLRMAVNLSARQFQQNDLVSTVRGIIEETGINAEWLELEITEGLAMHDLEHTIAILGQLKEMGIGVSLDDFGKGYSSLNYLKILPISNLKIDKTFIHGFNSSSNQTKIARALISLAHNMNLTVTAEGVENATQLEFLLKEGCDTAQGYYFSKPMQACDLELVSYETDLERTS
ncbi:MAG TPA: EAL domain-containing protein [Clostridia bacterium]|nr:EAL domain-containing protein [Clostridia bacterium]